MLRYNLANRNRQVLVLEELDAISKYIFILQMRYGNRLKINLNVPEDCQTCRMPPFLLQALMENALKHGLEKKLEFGELTFRSDTTPHT
jgi:sensor histidine kinase YesM